MTTLPEPVTEAIDYVCDGAVEITGCHPGYAVDPEREYVAAVRAALTEAIGRVPPSVLSVLASRLEAAADVCDANIALRESQLRQERAAALGLPKSRVVQPAVRSTLPYSRTPNGQRSAVILRAVRDGITDRNALANHVAEAMGETGERSASRNRTTSLLWSLAKRGILEISDDSVHLIEPPVPPAPEGTA